MIGARLADALVDVGVLVVDVAPRDEIDLDPVRTGPTEIQVAISVVIAVAVILFSSLFVKFWSSLILDDEEKEHAQAITSGLRSRDWFEVRIPRSALDDGFDEYRERIHAGFEGDFESPVPTLPEALGEVRKEWKTRRQAATSAVRGELPALSRLLSLDAVLYLLVGSVAVVPLETWGTIFSFTTGGNGSPKALVDAVVGGVELALTTIAAFPFAGKLYALTFLAVVSVGKLMYQHVFVVGLLLLFGSVVIWVGDRVVADDVEPRLYATKPRAALRVAGVVAATWLVGVLVAFGARSLHYTLGNAATAGLVTLVVVAVAARKATPTLDAAVAAWKIRKRSQNVADDVVAAATAAKTLADRVDDHDAEPHDFASDDDLVILGPIIDTDDHQVDADAASRSAPRSAIDSLPLKATAKAIVVALLAVAVSIGVGFATYSLDGGIWGATCGLLASLVVFGVLVVRELRAAHDQLMTAYNQADEHGFGPTGTTIYVANRKVFGVLGVFASAVIPFYLLDAFATGKAATVAEIALVDSSAQVKALMAFFAVAFAVFAVVQTRPAWGDLLEATRRSLDRNGLRIALLSRGFPVLVVVLAAPMLAGSGFVSPLNSLVIAVAIGVVVKAFFALKSRAEAAYADIDDEPPKPGRLFVKGVVVEDAHGNEIAVVDENGHRIAAPIDAVADPDDVEHDLPVGGVDELVDQIVADSESYFDDATYDGSVHSYYADRLDDGLVDFRRARTEYLGMIGKSIESELERAGRDGVDPETLDDRMTTDFDEDLYRRKFRELRKKPDGIDVYGGKVKKS